jgi:hypothetical protein
MRHKAVLLVLVVAVSVTMLAQVHGGSKPQDGTCAFNFVSGTDRAQTRYCVTANGNIAEIGIGTSPPIEYLTSPVSEGYGFCDANSVTSYYDYNRTASTNWNAAVATQTDPTSVVVTRTTSDGVWKLTQTFTQKKASKSAFGAVKITMALTNLSTLNRFAVLQRHVNVDAGGTPFNDFNSTAFTTTGSVPGNFGFSTTGGIITRLGDFGLAFNQTVPDGPVVCETNFNVAQGFFEGDGSSEQRFGLDILPGQTKKVTVTYKPI